MWYEDLTEQYFGTFGSLKDFKSMLAIGWLENGKPFQQGEISKEVYEKLCELNKNPWLFYISCGYHECDFCDKINANTLKHLPETCGTHKLTIPHNGKLYHYPELITHYIAGHSYLPPAEFCEAVLNCPLMNTMEYHKKMVDNGGERLLKYFEEYWAERNNLPK